MMESVKEEDEDMEASWSVDYLDTLEAEDTYEPVEFPVNYNYCGGSMASESLVGCSGFSARPDDRSGPLICGPVIGLGRNRQTVLSSQNKADFTALELEMGHSKFQGENGVKKRRVEPWCFPVTVMGILVLLIVCTPLFNAEDKTGEAEKRKVAQLCSGSCRLTLVETLELRSASRAFNDSRRPSVSALTVIRSAQFSLDIVAPFSHARAPTSSLISELREAVLVRNVKVRLVQPYQLPRTRPRFDPWSSFLPAGSVRSLNVVRFLPNPSTTPDDTVFNANFLIADKQHFYLGPLTSGNGTQRNPTLALATNCTCLAEDLSKLFSTYFYLAGLPTTRHAAAPQIKFPPHSITSFNLTYPLLLPYNNFKPSSVFISASPILLMEAGRTGYLDGLLAFIEGASHYLYIHVDDYSPVVSRDFSYWPVIDNAVRQAALGRRVKVKLLVNKYTTLNRRSLLQSLTALNPILHQPIEIKCSSWPIANKPPGETDPSATEIVELDDSRMNYIVGDHGVHFGTTSWQGEKILSALGLSISVWETDADEQSNVLQTPTGTNKLLGPAGDQLAYTSLSSQLKIAFERRWASSDALNVTSD